MPSKKYKQSTQHINNIRKARMANGGYKPSEAHKEKVRQSKLGNKASEITKVKMSLIHSGVDYSSITTTDLLIIGRQYKLERAKQNRKRAKRIIERYKKRGEYEELVNKVVEMHNESALDVEIAEELGIAQAYVYWIIRKNVPKLPELTSEDFYQGINQGKSYKEYLADEAKRSPQSTLVTHVVKKKVKPKRKYNGKPAADHPWRRRMRSEYLQYKAKLACSK